MCFYRLWLEKEQNYSDDKEGEWVCIPCTPPGSLKFSADRSPGFEDRKTSLRVIKHFKITVVKEKQTCLAEGSNITAEPDAAIMEGYSAVVYDIRLATFYWFFLK